MTIWQRIRFMIRVWVWIVGMGAMIASIVLLVTDGQGSFDAWVVGMVAQLYVVTDALIETRVRR